jgi:hypothetical protein
VRRLAPSLLGEALGLALFHTGDADLDALLESARSKFLSREHAVRKEGLDKLWDAYERLKTIEGPDKKASATALLEKAMPEPNLRAQIVAETTSLTSIGNNFMIRHTETTKTPITDSEDVDYLFHRMFALIRLLLRKTGRGG